MIENLKVKIFADGADVAGIRAMAARPWIRGFTTNPSLMRKAGVSDYAGFARAVLAAVPDRPVSFEVFADEFDEMERQALEIASWGPNVNVKIPVMNTRAEFAGPLVGRLSRAGVQVNVTAVFTPDQVAEVAAYLDAATPAIVSVFAGRIADTGVDPVPIMRESAAILRARPRAELLWASCREVLNVVQANDAGCHIVTVPNDLLAKVSLLGKDYRDYSLETVEMFYKDAWAAGYRPGGSQTLPSTHWMNQRYVDAGYVMDPHRPQGLVYANTHHGPVLLGAMFQMKSLNRFGPDPGGPMTAWHQHENICFTPFGFEFSLMTPYATCPIGAIDISAPPMLHVWIVDNPHGGPFAVDIDPSVVAALDRT